MVLDINLFRKARGGDPEIVRASQRRRFKDESVVDKVIELDEAWSKQDYATAQIAKEINAASKEFGQKKKAGEDTSAIASRVAELKEKLEESKAKTASLLAERDAVLNDIGNIVSEEAPMSADEENNLVVYSRDAEVKLNAAAAAGEAPVEGAEAPATTAVDRAGKPVSYPVLSHIRVLERLGATDCARGVKAAGSRGYYLCRWGPLLNQALITYALQFMNRRGYIPMHTPFFLEKDMMARCAELGDYDEQLYKVSGEGNDKYLIATSEQTLCAYHSGEVLQLPGAELKYRSIKRATPGQAEEVRTHEAKCFRYTGYSTCFRKEAGRHGADTLGIFRIHQFEKVEQFIICRPEDSWEAMEYMIDQCRDFYDSLGLSYRVVAIVSGALNNAAAKKYDLEAWFPGSKQYRELVSCSNCLDYQARSLDIKYFDAKGEKKYPHMLNSTLIATERALCCLVENYQTEGGVVVPEVLRPYVGADFLPYIG